MDKQNKQKILHKKIHNQPQAHLQENIMTRETRITRKYL
jgi:hypothetical protein